MQRRTPPTFDSTKHDKFQTCALIWFDVIKIVNYLTLLESNRQNLKVVYHNCQQIIIHYELLKIFKEIKSVKNEDYVSLLTSEMKDIFCKEIKSKMKVTSN